MDSLTQLVLGATVAAAVAPAGHRRKALAVGGVLGTLPDLDVFVDYGGPVENFTYHRGFTHSLIVLAPLAVLTWLALRRWWAPVREAPGRWFAAIALALLTHPMLDAHTSYGTQLFWPVPAPPVMWGTVFIIDPLFTLPLLAAAVFAAMKPHAARATSALTGALAFACVYLAWSWIAQAIVSTHARETLAARGVAGAAMFVTPTPFNTLLWRVLVMTDDGYLEGFDSLLLDEDGIDFAAHESDGEALAAADNVWAVRRLRWFASGFVRGEVRDGRLYVADLRMGLEPVYVFTHVVAARRGNPGWEAIPTELVSVDFADRSLDEVWARIWSE